VLIICSTCDMCTTWIAVLKVGRFSIGWFMLAARLVREHLDFCTSWGVIYVALTLCYKLISFSTLIFNLKFALHMNNVCYKAHKRSNLLLRCVQSDNVESLISAFKVYVRSILEYCSVVWNPCLLKDIKTIISAMQIYQTASRNENNFLSPALSYSKLGLESLELRQVLADILFTSKLVSGIINLKLSDFFFIHNFHRSPIPTIPTNL